MNASIISVRYAKALFELGKANENLIDKLYADCSFLLACLKESDELKSFLNNAVVKSDIKKRTIRKVFESQIDSNISSFIDIIIDNNRQSLLLNILIDFIDSYRKFKGIKSITVTTAVVMKEDFRSKVSNIICANFNCEVEIDYKINDEILGGIILQMDGKQVDSSVAGQLRLLKKNLMIN